MDDIAQALGVGATTVRRDLDSVDGPLTSRHMAESEWPKKKPRRKRSDGPTPEQLRRVIELHVDGDMGCNRAATEVGLGGGTVWKIGKKELERRASLEKPEPEPEPEKEQDQEEPGRCLSNLRSSPEELKNALLGP